MPLHVYPRRCSSCFSMARVVFPKRHSFASAAQADIAIAERFFLLLAKHSNVKEWLEVKCEGRYRATRAHFSPMPVTVCLLCPFLLPDWQEPLLSHRQAEARCALFFARFPGSLAASTRDALIFSHPPRLSLPLLLAPTTACGQQHSSPSRPCNRSCRRRFPFITSFTAVWALCVPLTILQD